MKKEYNIPKLPLKMDLETKEVLKHVNNANKKLAELKGIARTIPNEKILISSLVLQEARDSSRIENIITTQDDLYKADTEINSIIASPAIKEVQRYREAIFKGYEEIKQRKLLTNNTIIKIQNILKGNSGGFRVTPGTVLKKDDGQIIYTPPQHPDKIKNYMNNLEQFINDDYISDLDPLIKMAIIHHQFESIHPFTDGNGRAGRIINILYLVCNNLLDLPILYLSRYITHTKQEYYTLIQKIRESNGNIHDWTNWIIYILKGVEETAIQTTELVIGISELMAEYKSKLKPVFRNTYRHELLNNLFYHPYTKIDFLRKDLSIERRTSAKYLNIITDMGLLRKERFGKEYLYINDALISLFVKQGQ